MSVADTWQQFSASVTWDETPGVIVIKDRVERFSWHPNIMLHFNQACKLIYVHGKGWSTSSNLLFPAPLSVFIKQIMKRSKSENPIFFREIRSNSERYEKHIVSITQTHKIEFSLWCPWKETEAERFVLSPSIFTQDIILELYLVPAVLRHSAESK